MLDKILNKLLNFLLDKNIPLKHSENFLTYHKRPINSSEYRFQSDILKNSPKLGLVMQGPLMKEDNFTLETVKLYKKTFENTEIIVSTWKTENLDYIEKIKEAGATVILNDPPEFAGISNVNYQIKSSIAGIRKAKEIGCEYAIKARTDQRMYASNIKEFLFNLLKIFPLSSEIQVQKQRLITCSANTFKYRLYGLSDMFLFGHIDDVLLFWSVKEDNRNFDKNDAFYTTSLRNYCKSKLVEVYFTCEFLQAVGKNLSFTLQDSWQSYSKHFCVIDKESLDLCWPKYTNKEHRWIKYTPYSLEELSFKEWLNIYTGLDNKIIPEQILDEPLGNLKPVILSRTSHFGDFVLNKLETETFAVKNHHKSRIDYILECSKNENYTVKANFLKPYTIRDDIQALMEQSQNNFFGYYNVKAIIMDSFSELADKLFISKDGWAFCSDYTDVDHSGDFDDNFRCEDLLPFNQLKAYYIDFFNKLKETYGEIPVIFLHFPAKFDNREEYRQRAMFINDIISELAGKYSNLHSINVDDELIVKNELDDFPYHFSNETIEAFLNKILELNIDMLKKQTNKGKEKLKYFIKFPRRTIKNFLKKDNNYAN